MKTESLQILTDGSVFLNLPKVIRKNRRFIGTIDIEKKTFSSSNRNRRFHLFKTTNSLSVPYDLIYMKNYKIKFLCINYEKEKLWTSSLMLKRHGCIMHFKEKGIEKQIFLELNKFKSTKNEARAERNMLRKG